MARPELTRPALPAPGELQGFARAAARLLVERQVRTTGMRVIRRRVGSGVQHLGHRDYVPGDEVRHIDWRQTARRGRTILREFEAESASEWMLLLDLSSSMTTHGGAKWRAALNAAAALSYTLLELGHRVGLLAFGRGVRAECRRGRGGAHYVALARTLAALQPQASGEGSELGACAARLGGDVAALVISDGLSLDGRHRELAALLERCAQLQLLQVEDAADRRLAASGEMELVDVETGSRMAALVDERAAALADAAHAAAVGRLRDFCARSGIVHSRWDVVRAWQPALIEHLARARSVC